MVELVILLILSTRIVTSVFNPQSSSVLTDTQSGMKAKTNRQSRSHGFTAKGKAMRSFEHDCIAMLKVCAKKKNICEGTIIHESIMKRGLLLQKNPYVASAVINMYAKCGNLTKAKEVLEELSNRYVGSWSALIGGYMEMHQGQEALNCFQRMQSECISPDAITFTSILKVCGKTRDIDKGKHIHSKICGMCLLEKDIMLGGALVDMYAKCGVLMMAQQVLEALPIRNIISWSSLISGYADHGQGHDAFICFEQMQSEGFSPDAIIFTCLLKACGIAQDIEKGKNIHEEIVKEGLLEKDSFLGNGLVDMYVKCGRLAKAQQVLGELPKRDVVSWNTLIAGYVQQRQGYEALTCFNWMQNDGIPPNVVTFILILSACGYTRAIDKGKQIHEKIMNRGLLEKDIMLGNALIDMYAKCGMLSQAQKVLEELPLRDIVSWNALISGYAEEGQGFEALNSFDCMQSEGVLPDVVTFICVLKACGITRAIEKGDQIYEEILSRNLLAKDITLGTALVDMYAKCGVLSKAQEILEELPIRNLVTWSALITGYTQQGQGYEALNNFEQMQSEGLSPDSVTFISILKACGSTGAIEIGENIHEIIARMGLLDNDIVLGTALVDMYGKCGMLAKAKGVLEELPERNIVSWNALLAGYSQHGQGHEALDCFAVMQNEGVCPNAVTFLCVLSACNHSGLLGEAQMLFENMRKKYGISPNIEHHTSMIMAYGSSGHFDMAMSVIEAMPSSDYLTVWLALLGSCEKWGNVKLACLAFHQAVQLDNNCATTYALMASIFADANMQEDAEMVEAMRLRLIESSEDII